MTEHALVNGKRGYSWPPFEVGNEAAVKSGGHSPRKLQPIAEELAAGLTEAAPWTSAAVFRPTVEAWAWAEAQAISYRRWFAEREALLEPDADSGEPAGLVSWDRAERRAANLRAELGLSPASMSRLLSSLSSIDGPAAQDGLAALRAAGAALRASTAAGRLEAGHDGAEGES